MIWSTLPGFGIFSQHAVTTTETQHMLHSHLCLLFCLFVQRLLFFKQFEQILLCGSFFFFFSACSVNQHCIKFEGQYTMYSHQRKKERKKTRPRAEANLSSLSFPSFWHGFSPFQIKYNCFLTDQAWESDGGGLQLAVKWEVGRGV